jgi:hypothetical protein
MMALRLARYFSRGTCCFFGLAGRQASFAPKRTSWWWVSCGVRWGREDYKREELRSLGIGKGMMGLGNQRGSAWIGKPWL